VHNVDNVIEIPFSADAMVEVFPRVLLIFLAAHAGISFVSVIAFTSSQRHPAVYHLVSTIILFSCSVAKNYMK
jgi:hypothetical protein